MLKQEQIREVLARAEEIEQESGPWRNSADAEALLRAAEEVGISRDAMIQAIQEFSPMIVPPEVGSRVFARSSDDHFYVADVIDASEGGVRVRFLQGSEHTVPTSDIRPLDLLPGQKLMCNWKGWWGWGTASIVSYNPKTERVEATDGFMTKKFRLHDVRLRERQERPFARKVMFWLFTAAALGGAAGSLITMWLSR